MEEKEPMYDITDIAEWFLTKSDTITHKKLQKLCYFAVAWNWGINKEPLCKRAEFQAWVHGAVSPILYNKYKKHGWKYILQSDKSNIKEKKVIEILNLIWNSLGNYEGEILEDLIHNEEPYKKARGCLERYEPCNHEIDIEDMKQYYGDLCEKWQIE